MRTDGYLTVVTPTQRVLREQRTSEPSHEKAKSAGPPVVHAGISPPIVLPRPTDVRAASRKIRGTRAAERHVCRKTCVRPRSHCHTIVPPRLNRRRTCHRLLLKPCLRSSREKNHQPKRSPQVKKDTTKSNRHEDHIPNVKAPVRTDIVQTWLGRLSPIRKNGRSARKTRDRQQATKSNIATKHRTSASRS